MGQSLPFHNQPYSSHTFQVLIQLQYGIAHLGYQGGMKIPIAQAIPGYFGYPPLDTGTCPSRLSVSILGS